MNFSSIFSWPCRLGVGGRGGATDVNLIGYVFDSMEMNRLLVRVEKEIGISIFREAMTLNSWNANYLR